MANEKWSTWASMGPLTGTEKLVGLDGSANEYTTPTDIKTFMGLEKIAWCTFDGTTGGTNAPTLGYNVTSVTRNGTGDYTINFTNNFSNANYCATGMVRRNPAVADNGNLHVEIGGASPSVSALRVLTLRPTDAVLEDGKIICVQITGT